MAIITTQRTYTRALKTNQGTGTSNAIVPNPTKIKTGTVSSIGLAPDGNQSITDSSADFITSGVAVGDVIYNDTSKIVTGTITGVSTTTLNLNNTAIFAAGNLYVIWQASSQTGPTPTGAVLWNGGAATATGTSNQTSFNLLDGTSVNNIFLLTNQTLPFQVSKVNAWGGTTNLAFALS